MPLGAYKSNRARLFVSLCSFLTGCYQSALILDTTLEESFDETVSADSDTLTPPPNTNDATDLSTDSDSTAPLICPPGWGLSADGTTCLDALTAQTLSSGGTHVCALKWNGEAICRGFNAYGQADPSPGVFQHISSGEYHS